jgi:hypothetical protein
MVLRQAFWLVAAVGATSIPLHIETFVATKQRREELVKSYEIEREVLYAQRLKQLAEMVHDL